MSSGKMILLVESDPAGRAELAGSLVRLGHTVRCAASCAEALDELHSRRPDLIVLDARTAQEDGGTFRRRYRQDRALAEIPLVVLAVSEPPGEGEPLATDVTHFPNPIDRDQLLAALGRPARRNPPASDSGGPR
jgi:CheY-like chemotaxis protein